MSIPSSTDDIVDIVVDSFDGCHIRRRRRITIQSFNKTGSGKPGKCLDGKELIGSCLASLKRICDDAIRTAPATSFWHVSIPGIISDKVLLAIVGALKSVRI